MQPGRQPRRPSRFPGLGTLLRAYGALAGWGSMRRESRCSKKHQMDGLRSFWVPRSTLEKMNFQTSALAALADLLGWADLSPLRLAYYGGSNNAYTASDQTVYFAEAIRRGWMGGVRTVWVFYHPELWSLYRGSDSVSQGLRMFGWS